MLTNRSLKFYSKLIRLETQNKTLSHIYAKKYIPKEENIPFDVQAKKIKIFDFKDHIKSDSYKELYEAKNVSQHSVIQRKLNNNFHYICNFKYNDTNNFAFNKIGMNFTSCKKFSIKEEKTNKVTPNISLGGDFRDLIKKSTIFVDKSLFIKEIIDDISKVILLTMPRRWGKSLNMDMLRRFLSVEIEENGRKIPKDESENYKLFAGGLIKNLVNPNHIQKQIFPCALVNNYHEFLALQGKFPVIFLDLKDCKGITLEDVKEKVKNKIIQTIQSFGYLQLSNKPFSGFTTIGQQFSKLLENANSGIVNTAIQELSSLLKKYHNEQVWILIDEYDAALNKAYLEFSEQDAKKVSLLFISILEPALKGNSDLQKAVLTGVQSIVQSDMLSGLNNISKHNINSSRYAEYYGIDQEEMDLLLKHFNIEQQKALKIKVWYNGYKTNYGSVEKPNYKDKYNIWSVVNYLNKQSEGFKPYWENNSLGEVISEDTFEDSDLKDIIQDLIANKNLDLGELTRDFNLNDFKILKEIIQKHDLKEEIKEDGINLLFSYLFFTGYLTNTCLDNEYALPNSEIRMAFEKKLKNYYKKIFRIPYSEIIILSEKLNLVFTKKDILQIPNVLTESFAPKLSALIEKLEVYNKKNEKLTDQAVFGNESLMHSLLNFIAIKVVHAKFGSERLTIKPDGSQGRADIVVSKNQTTVVIEMKYNNNVGKTGDLKQLAKIQAKQALKQAKSYTNLVENNNTKIYIGCNITDQKAVFLSGEIINNKKLKQSIEFDYP